MKAQEKYKSLFNLNFFIVFHFPKKHLSWPSKSITYGIYFIYIYHIKKFILKK